MFPGTVVYKFKKKGRGMTFTCLKFKLVCISLTPPPHLISGLDVTKTSQKVKPEVTEFMVSSGIAIQESSVLHLTKMVVKSYGLLYNPLQLSSLWGPDPVLLVAVAESAVISLMTTI